MTPNELSALCDIRRTLERIKNYCENRSFFYDKDLEKWRYLISEANYGLIKVKDIERSAK